MSPAQRKKKGKKKKDCQKTSYYLCAPEISTEKGGNFEEGTFFFCVPQSIYLVPNSEYRSDFNSGRNFSCVSREYFLHERNILKVMHIRSALDKFCFLEVLYFVASFLEIVSLSL